jgi:glutamyl/glutaminyl-tRNA synthetase
LGISWEEGPDREGPLGPYRQSQRISVYRQFADRLSQE